MNNSLYFPVYQKIEKEVIELTSSIYFSDDQIDVYSLKIADLIIRCSIELESIAKDIYRMNNGKEPSKPGDAFVDLDNTWNLSRKILTIISPYTHFEQKFTPSFAPFDYSEKASEDYFAAYNAIKHDRAKNIAKANVNTLIRVLGALYVLNLYYRSESIYLKHDCYGRNMDKSLGSDFFAFAVAPLDDIVKLSSEKDIDSQTCVYRIVRNNTDFGFKITFIDNHNEEKSWTLINIKKEFQEFAKTLLGQQINKEEFFNNNPLLIKEDIFLTQMKAKQIIDIKSVKPETSYYAMI